MRMNGPTGKGIIKWVVYITGVLIFAMGVAVTIKSSLGVSPVSSVPYILSRTSSFSVGRITAALFTGFIILQMVILKKEYRKRDLLQIVFALFFGAFVDGSLHLISPLRVEGMLPQLLLLMIGTLLISLGILFLIKADIMLSPGDGLVRAMSIRSRIPFPRVKIGFDVFCALLSGTISLIWFKTLDGVGIGTILGALGVGFAIQWLDSLIGKPIEGLIKGSTGTQSFEGGMNIEG